MGLLGSLFGGGVKVNRNELARAEGLARKLFSSHGEELKPTVIDGRTGYSNPAGVIGVFASKALDLSQYREVRRGELQHDGSLVGFEDGTQVEGNFLDSVLGLLETEGIGYRMFVRKNGIAPMLIKIEGEDILIAPVIKSV